MQHPPFLQKGATIGITCPSGYVSNERVIPAIETLQSWGFRVKVGNTVGNEFHYFSGTDEERASDLQAMLDDPMLSAIIMGRGGYGLSRIIDQLDFTLFKKFPKWICGFSDITVLHQHTHQNIGIATLHSPMCGAFKDFNENCDYLCQFKSILQGEPQAYLTPPNEHNRFGSAESTVIGGNLAIISHLVGSSSDIDSNGKILFLEDIGEHLYQIDRMLMQLKRAGKLKGLKGLILGSFTEIEDTERPFGQSLETIISSKVEEYDFPICFGFPIGHQKVNFSLALGMKHRLDVDASGGRLELIL